MFNEQVSYWFNMICYADFQACSQLSRFLSEIQTVDEALQNTGKK